MALRGVIHPEIVADLTHDDLAGIEADAHGEADGPFQSQLVGVEAKLLPKMKRREAGSPRMVLVRDRRTEERHDPIAGVLVDRAFEAVNSFGQDREEAIHDL